MPATVKHPFTSAIADSGDSTLVQPSNWNAPHTLSGGAVGDILYSSDGTAISTLAVGSTGTVLVGGTTPSYSANPQVSTIELGNASDTTISRTGAGAIAVEGVGVALNSTSLTHTASTIELGHASDTTLSRSSAGVLAVEGVVVPTVSSTDTLTNKTLTTPVIATINGGSAASSSLTLQSTSGTGTSDAILFKTGSQSERMRIDTSGNVGIGGPPDYKLDVFGGALRLNGNARTVAGDASIYFGSTTNNYIYSGNGTNLMAFATNGSERLRIDSSGNVGIGTTSPDALLTVNTIASFGDGAVTTPSIAHKGDLNTGFWFPAADTIAASTGGSERLRIDSSGRFMVGTTSAGGSGIAIANNNNSSTNRYWLAGDDTGHWIYSSGSGGNQMFFGEYNSWYFYNTNTSANVASIDSSGTYTKLSDQAVKTNIKPIEYGLSEISKLRSVSYTYTGGKTPDQDGYDDLVRNNCLGFIAQEVEEIIPHVVSQIDSEKKLLSVDYVSIIPVLVKAIQELKADFDAYKAAHP